MRLSCGTTGRVRATRSLVTPAESGASGHVPRVQNLCSSVDCVNKNVQRPIPIHHSYVRPYVASGHA